VFRANGWRRSWFEAIGHWTFSDDLVSVLFSALNNEEDPMVQRSIALTLAKIGNAHPIVANRLEQFAVSALNINKRAAALIALVQGWSSREGLIEVIAEAANSGADQLRLAAIAGRIVLGRADETELKELIDLAADDDLFAETHGWRDEIMRCLISGWKGNELLKESCIDVVNEQSESRNFYSKETAFAVLLHAFPGDHEVAQLFATLLKDSRTIFPSLLHLDGWRALAANFKGHLGLTEVIDTKVRNGELLGPEMALAGLLGKTQFMKQRLIEALNEHLPFWPAESLLQGWGMGDEEVASALESMAYGDAAKASAIARSIPAIVRDKAKARDRLMMLLEEPCTPWHHWIVEGLSSIQDIGDEEKIVDLALKVRSRVKAFDHNTFDWSLITGFAKVPKIRALAIERLKTRIPLVEPASFSYGNDPEIRSLVLDLLCPLPATLRSSIVENLSKQHNEKFSCELLSKYDLEEDDDIKTAASIGFHKRLVAEGREPAVALASLAETISCYGPDFEDRRRAAFAGLMILEHLNLMKGQNETHTGKPIAISLSKFYEPNIPLVRLVAEHWRYLNEIFGNELPERLSHQGAVIPIPVALAPVASEFQELQEYIWAAAREDDKLTRDPAVLRLFSEIYPHSDWLRDHCLSALRNDDRTRGSFDRHRVVVEILVSQFAGEPYTFLGLVDGLDKRFFPSGIIMALCAGWPNTSKAIELYRWVEAYKNELGITYPEYYAILYANIPSSGIAERLLSDVRQCRNDPHSMQALLGPVLSRLRRDSETREALVTWLRSATNSDGKATFPRLLAKCGPISEELAPWMHDELRLQLSPSRRPDIGVDLVAGGTRSVALSLLDVMQG